MNTREIYDLKRRLALKRQIVVVLSSGVTKEDRTSPPTLIKAKSSAFLSQRGT